MTVKQAIEKGQSTKAMKNLAILYYEKGQKENSLIYYKQLVDGYNMYEEAYNTGMICNQLKQKEEALKYFGISYEKANNKNALYYLGVINYDLGKMELAKKYLKMAEKNGDEAAKLMLEGME